MIPERDDPIIDPLLAELLGRDTPPDLSSRIIQAWDARRAQLTRSTPQPLGRRRRRTQETLQFVVSLTVASLLLGVVYLGFTWRGNDHVPHTNTTAAAPFQGPAEDKSAGHLAASNEPAKSAPVAAPDPLVTSPLVTSPRVIPASEQLASQPPPSAAGNNSPPVETASPTAPATRSASVTPTMVVEFVNARLQAEWHNQHIAPAPLASDDQWCRRVYVRIIGRIPTVVELTQFVRDPSAHKRAKLVEQLLRDEAYVVDFAKHWSVVWTNTLLGRGVGLTDDEPASRAGMEKFLRDAFARELPFDHVVRELLTATGSGRPGVDGSSGAANFLLASVDDQAIAATDRICRVLLGVRLQCARCHDHPTESWKQSDYWSLNAFLRQVRVSRTDRNDPPELLDSDYFGDDGRDPQGLVFYESPHGLLRAAEPRFLDGRTPASSSGAVTDVNRREELARFVVTSDLFAQAIVNRTWAQFHGYGFTQPLDALGQVQPPSHPEILHKLAQEFRASGFNYRALLQWIALSDSFQRSATPTADAVVDAPASGTRPLFSYYYARPLSGEEVIRSLQIAAQLRREAGDGSRVAQARVDWLAQYHRSLPREETSELGTPAVREPGLIPGGLIMQATATGYDSLLQSVLQANLPFRDKVEHLFLAALSRKPTPSELEAAKKLAGLTGAREDTALEDTWWALLHSSEFLLDH